MHKTTRAEQVYDLIIEKIISERMQPGTQLREDHLAAEFGISSTPVREALRRLEQDGWVQNRPYCGSCIRKYSLQEIRELYQLRMADEMLAAYLACEEAANEDFAEMENALVAEDAFIAEARQKCVFVPAFRTDLDFHLAIVRASHSQTLVSRNGKIAPQFKLMNLTSLDEVSLEQMLFVREEHGMIFQALKRRWPEAAAALLKSHIIEACERHISLMAN